jgi:large repetitive protein
MEWELKDPDVDGIKTVYVKFDDQAGNISATYQDTIELSLLTPETRIISGPASLTDETTAQFKYEATKLNSKFSYKLDENDWSEWSDEGSVTFTGLIAGNHYFYVKSALDLNADTEITPDEEDPTPAQWVWMIESEKEYQKAKRKTLFWRR